MKNLLETIVVSMRLIAVSVLSNATGSCLLSRVVVAENIADMNRELLLGA